MLVTVIGIEMTKILRSPNGVECDRCGRRVNFDRREYVVKRDELRCQGWIIPDWDRSLDVFCPDHAVS